ncbi:DUF362 domain-containing protein [candidate division WOR-3 bacterium]|nr:DUF362 domain-containing protein [candidate division WOR-3 bacterium]
MKSTVIYSEIKNQNIGQALEKITAKMSGVFSKKDVVAVKTHFGERGNTTFIPSHYLKMLVASIKKAAGPVFVTDTNVLYRSERSETVLHLNLAFDHGFTHEKIGAPVIIADGFNGGDVVRVKTGGKHFRDFPVAGAIHRADGLAVFSHFKGHLLAGAGGAIKNLAMGGASRAGKQMMHADVVPERRRDKKCIKCSNCSEKCPESAISFDYEGPVFNIEKCVGCGECIAACPEGVIKILWNADPENFSQKLAEGAKAVLMGKENSSIFINGLISITPECDCIADAGKPLVEDLGWLFSTDPVAIDTASYDLVLKKSKGEDLFLRSHPSTCFQKCLDYAEHIGLGSRDYVLEKTE